jgi:hypothetical protein
MDTTRADALVFFGATGERVSPPGGWQNPIMKGQ